MLGIYLKKKYKNKLSLWVQDLWPDSVKNTGFIKNKFLLYLLSLVVSYIYRNSDNIIAQSKGFKQNINKYVKKKIYIVENSHFNIQTKKIKNNLKIENILKNKFFITFSGNIGKAQSIPTIIEVCRKLRNYKNIHFLLIGVDQKLSQLKN